MVPEQEWTSAKMDLRRNRITKVDAVRSVNRSQFAATPRVDVTYLQRHQNRNSLVHMLLHEEETHRWFVCDLFDHISQ